MLANNETNKKSYLIWQCGNCSKIFSDKQFDGLQKESVSAWDVKFLVEDYDLGASDMYDAPICDRCNAIFHVDTWQIKSYVKDKYSIITGHIECATIPSDSSGMPCYWFATSVKVYDEYISFRVSYDTKERAEEGHKLVLRNIELIQQYPSLFYKGLTLEQFAEALAMIPSK